MSIRIKLLGLLLLVGMVPLVVTGFLGYETGKQGLIQTAMNQLTGIRRSKAYQIETYFRGIRSQVRTLQNSALTIRAMVTLRSEFERLNGLKPSSELRATIREYYRTAYLTRLHQLMDQRPSLEHYLP